MMYSANNIANWYLFQVVPDPDQLRKILRIHWIELESGFQYLIRIARWAWIYGILKGWKCGVK